MKLLVETNGAIQLIDHDKSNPIMRHEGYTVVTSTDFVQYRLSLGQVSIIAELSDDATDMEWLKYYEESDHDLVLARESFLSKFGKKAKEPAKPHVPGKPAPANKAEKAEG